jgi:ATP/maltotriose-dependent transcriptional regulator MalT
MEGRPDFWTYSLEKHHWDLHNDIILKEREKEILLMSIQNYSEEEIGNNLHISKQTIKYHKQKLFDKLSVNNMAAAIAVASSHKMI